MEGDVRRPQDRGGERGEYSQIEPTSDAAEEIQAGRRKDDEGDRVMQTPPDVNDELGQYEGSYEESGVTTDTRDDYGTGGGDVGIGGDVSPHGAMHDAAATAPDVDEDEDLMTGAQLTRQGLAERDEDLDLVSDDIVSQGNDEAWPRQDELSEDDPRAAFDDADSPLTDLRDENELTDAA